MRQENQVQEIVYKADNHIFPGVGVPGYIYNDVITVFRSLFNTFTIYPYNRGRDAFYTEKDSSSLPARGQIYPFAVNALCSRSVCQRPFAVIESGFIKFPGSFDRRAGPAEPPAPFRTERIDGLLLIRSGCLFFAVVGHHNRMQTLLSNGCRYRK